MKNLSKLTALLSAAAMTLSPGRLLRRQCRLHARTGGHLPRPPIPPPPPGATYTVGICQLVTHDALDAATQGFMDALPTRPCPARSEFDVQNAAGDSIPVPPSSTASWPTAWT